MNTKLKYLWFRLFIPLAACSPFTTTVPPVSPLILRIDGKEQISGIGSLCWKVSDTESECATTAGIPTAQEPLAAHSSFTAHFLLPLSEAPDQLVLNVFQVTAQDEITEEPSDWRWWQPQGERRFYNLPLEHQPIVELSLEPGLYVFEVYVVWQELGDVSYGFLVAIE